MATSYKYPEKNTVSSTKKLETKPVSKPVSKENGIAWIEIADNLYKHVCGNGDVYIKFSTVERLYQATKRDVVSTSHGFIEVVPDVSINLNVTAKR